MMNAVAVMDNGTQVFQFDGAKVRVLMKDGEPWFVAKDVCDALLHTNSRKALENLDEDEKGYAKVYTVGGAQEMAIVNESGVYTLVIRSNLPEAKRFRKWVTNEVLPSIRKHGMYLSDPMLERAVNLVDNPLDFAEEFGKTLLAYAEERKARRLAEAKSAQLETVVKITQPKAEVFDETYGHGRLETIDAVCRRFHGVNTIGIKKALFEMGYFWKPKYGGYRVYAAFRDREFVEKRNPITTNKDIFVTPDGVQLLTSLYKERKLPMKNGFK